MCDHDEWDEQILLAVVVLLPRDMKTFGSAHPRGPPAHSTLDAHLINMTTKYVPATGRDTRPTHD